MDIAFDLQIFWFVIIIAATTCYAILDGFDLGVGILHQWTREDLERRVFLNAIGPVWDGNEVWLVVVIGGLLAGFPEAYATILSSFYLPTTIFIAGLIFRAVAIEFRSKRSSTRWRYTWDFLFSLASWVIAFGIGVFLGNLISGIPLDKNKEFVGTFWTFFHPYALLVGVTTINCLTMHGAIYLAMKTEGALQDKVRRWIFPLILSFVFFYVLTTGVTLWRYPHMHDRLLAYPWLYLLAIASLLFIANIPRQNRRKNDGWAFVSSCGGIAALLALFALGTYPNLVRSSLDPLHNSVTVFEAAASQTTLLVLLIIVCIGLPLVFAYGFLLYRIFRGKVTLDKMSY